MHDRATRPGDPRYGPAVLSLLALAGAGGLPAAPLPVLLQEGTDISVATSPDGQQLITDVAGRLWRLGSDGGVATPLTPPTEFAQRPTLSRDGRSIAYQSLRGGYFQIVRIGADGSAPRQLTSGDYHHIAPAWSADGRRLVVASNRSGDFGLWELDPELLVLSQLTFEPGDEIDPAWDPSGRVIAYVAAGGPHGGLYLREPFRPAEPLVVNGQRLRAPAWRPDGSLITFVAERREGPRLNMVILSDPPVVKAVSPTERAFPFPASWVNRERFLYTADGRIRQRELGSPTAAQIPFAATVEIPPVNFTPARSRPDPPGPQPVQGVRGLAVRPDGHIVIGALGDLWELAADGALVRQLTHDPYVDADPAVSPDGKSLAFTSDRDGVRQVWLLEFASGETRQITREAAGADRPAWNPSGERLAYLTGGGDGGPALRLMAVTLKSGATTVLAADLTEAGAPVWSPDATQVALITERKLLFAAADGAAGSRRLTLMAEALGPGPNHLAWADDGRSVALASSAGVVVLPILDSGLIGADWRRVSNVPATMARWEPGDRSLILTSRKGLVRVRADDGVTTPVPVPLAVPSAAPGQTLVVRASRVFDGRNGVYLRDQDIVIEANRITAVRPWSDGEPASRVFDARGKTVMPGLIDLAVSLAAPAAERLGRTLLAFGITSVQGQAEDAADLRETAERWQMYRSGPRLFTSLSVCGAAASASLIMHTPGLTSLRLCSGLALDPAQTIARPAREAGLALWSAGWLPLLLGSADAVGPGIGGPWPDPVAPWPGSGLYQDAVDIIARSGAVLIPALAARHPPLLAAEANPLLLGSPQYQTLFPPAERRRLEQAWKERSDSLGRRQLRDEQRLLGRILAGGGRLAAASAAPATPYGLGLHAELQLLTGVGLGAADVLRMATGEAARLLGLESDLGSIAAGRLADLLIVDGDPLADVGDILRIDAVILNGEPKPLAELLRGPAALENFTQADRQMSANRGPRR